MLKVDHSSGCVFSRMARHSRRIGSASVHFSDPSGPGRSGRAGRPVAGCRWGVPRGPRAVAAGARRDSAGHSPSATAPPRQAQSWVHAFCSPPESLARVAGSRMAARSESCCQWRRVSFALVRSARLPLSSCLVQRARSAEPVYGLLPHCIRFGSSPWPAAANAASRAALSR